MEVRKDKRKSMSDDRMRFTKKLRVIVEVDMSSWTDEQIDCYNEIVWLDQEAKE